jgi:hypothetical protein
MFLMMNEMIKVSPVDALQFITTFKFKVEFKDQLTEFEKMLNEDAEGEYKFKRTDPNIKSKIKANEKYLKAFIRMIINKYENDPLELPLEMKQINMDLHDTDGGIDNVLGKIFEFTRMTRCVNDSTYPFKKDILTVSEVDQMIKEYSIENHIEISKSAYKLYFSKMGVISGVNKNTRVYYGITWFRDEKCELDELIKKI